METTTPKKIKRFKKAILIIVSGTLAGLILGAFLHVQINKKIYASRVTQFLVEQNGYTADEIESVKGVWGKKLPRFYVTVVFKDEPEVEYIYFAHNNVMQFSYVISEEGKQKGITEAGLKHLVPNR